MVPSVVSYSKGPYNLLLNLNKTRVVRIVQSGSGIDLVFMRVEISLSTSII